MAALPEALFASPGEHLTEEAAILGPALAVADPWEPLDRAGRPVASGSPAHQHFVSALAYIKAAARGQRFHINGVWDPNEFAKWEADFVWYHSEIFMSRQDLFSGNVRIRRRPDLIPSAAQRPLIRAWRQHGRIPVAP